MEKLTMTIDRESSPELGPPAQRRKTSLSDAGYAVGRCKRLLFAQLVIGLGMLICLIGLLVYMTPFALIGVLLWFVSKVFDRRYLYWRAKFYEASARFEAACKEEEAAVGFERHQRESPDATPFSA